MPTRSPMGEVELDQLVTRQRLALARFSAQVSDWSCPRIAALHAEGIPGSWLPFPMSICLNSAWGSRLMSYLACFTRARSAVP